MQIEKLTSVQLDVLREIGNIGAGNAATSMSLLTNQKVDMDVPVVQLIPFGQVMELIGGADELVVAIYLRILGEAPGTVYFIMSLAEAEQLVRQIIHDNSFTLGMEEEIDDFAISALMEAGNILTGSYLSALSDFININMQPSIPNLAIDMAGAILSVGLIELSNVTDYAIVIDTRMNNDEDRNRFKGHFFLLPDTETVPKIFNALGIDYYE
ncbi:chemotaxis protein CheC [Aciduricibacillus chroicocephali]|uniref:Chemotaxis protein CheC n=1 Tax=Aciduricibacillus chroicocephali TaxID=3054939 RepID=A0ABY9KY47_9BACI|nr:chemotaxis protein CheC [Bacillaceae bacterium 44XB]